MKPTTKVVCPKCGAEIAISEQEHVTIGLAIGADSGLGVIELPLANNNKKAIDRIKQLEDAGIDVSSLFAMTKPDGGQVIAIRLDNVVTEIKGGGDVRSSHLFKQHVLAQMFKMLLTRTFVGKLRKYVTKQCPDGTYDMSSYTERMKMFGYDYTWRVLVEELGRQESMFKHGDTKCFREDNRWYNKELAIAMIDDYFDQLQLLLHSHKTHLYKKTGETYICYSGAEKILKGKKDSDYGYLYLNEFAQVFRAIKMYREAIQKATTPRALYNAVKAFVVVMPTLYSSPSKLEDRKPFTTHQCKEWQDAYKGYGAFFSMQNLIRFHRCVFFENRKRMTKEASLKKLDSMAAKEAGWYLLGALKQLIVDNKIDIEAKQKEWKEKKLANRK
jgi:hypothetical protein